MDIQEIKTQAIDNLDRLLSALGVDLSDSMPCPVHGGDNPTACSVSLETGMWCCFTNRCHEQYKGNVFGLIRGILEHNSNQEYTFYQTILWISKTLGLDTTEKIKFETSEIQSLLRQYRSQKNKVDAKTFIPTDIFLKSWKPSEYFKTQGISDQIINEYKLLDCLNPDKPLYGRACAPVFSLDNKYIIGFTGRIMKDECSRCGKYHFSHNCGRPSPKWLHWGLKSNNALYGLNLAAQSIKKTKEVYLCEGPKDVWQMKTAGYDNVVGIFGVNLSHSNTLTLSSLGCSVINLLLDNDPVGYENTQRLIKYLKNYFKVNNLTEKLPDLCDINDTKGVICA